MEQLRVLIVDDEPGMRLGVTRVLDGHSFVMPNSETNVEFSTEEAETGEAALEILRDSPPPLVLLDQKLPGIAGTEVLERIRAEKVDSLPIMITAHASIEAAVKATRNGAYDFLPKPFTPEELRQAVEKAAIRVVLGKRAKALEEEKRRVRLNFIRVLGHELKAPISAVEGYIDLFRKETLGKDLDSYDHVIDRSKIRLEQMRKLIVDLLDMTKIEAGELERSFEELDIEAMVKESMELVEQQAHDRNIELHCSAQSGLRFLGVRRELEIILNNLVSNAVKYNRDGGRVDVDLSQGEDGLLCISVADTGIGMTEEERSRLFQEFVRIKNKKTRNILGSGLGLSVVKKLSETYGGETSVESTPDVGSTFRVTLRTGSSIEKDGKGDV